LALLLFIEFFVHLIYNSINYFILFFFSSIGPSARHGRPEQSTRRSTDARQVGS
jgi:hypothetical protein